MTRRRFVLTLAISSLLTLGSSTSAQAIPGYAEIGRAAVSSPSEGSASILMPVRYGIEFAGRRVETRVRVVDPGHGTVRSWALHDRLSNGPRHTPERRRLFTFVHRLDLDSSLAAQLRDGLTVRVMARAVADVDADGKVDLHAVDETVRRLRPGRDRTCSTLPRLRVRPGRRVSMPLPVCGDEIDWKVGVHPHHGNARIRQGRFIYTAPRRFRGGDQVRLSGKQIGLGSAGASAAPIPSDVQITVGTAGGVVVRALGDSVTAGFGYYSTGKQMQFVELDDCRPAAKQFNDACSSNSLGKESKEESPVYAPDYGLANNVSWAAQWANEHGVTNYKNYAISGSEPRNWAPGGEFYEATKKIELEDPDYILLTLGANPLLSNVLFGEENMECAIFGNFQECIEKEFARVGLRKNLKNLYTDLVDKTSATIYLMQYHLSVPWSALAYTSTQIAEMGQFLNREIASAAAEVSPSRLRVVTPPHFNVGIDISPVYPSRYTCRLYPVDGPSVQSTGTQDELEDHVLSFCSGPAGGGPPWVINGDTGIHPSAAGYTQMASQVPPPS
jgi:lysophospholipase L1-like esterase